MKKFLLSTALVGVAFAAAPAMAQVDVTVGGHTKNYIGFLSQDDETGFDASDKERSFDMLRESELHFNAEGTADNGLTYGFHVETEVDGADGFDVEESYLYLASSLGRLNLGSEDGAAYLLQVAAPSADSNIDGLRQYINPVNYDVTSYGDDFAAGGIDYDQDSTGTDEKITYLSPNWSGFQFGLTYVPDVASNSTESINGSSLIGFAGDDAEDNLSSAYEGALRYEGTFNNIGFALGGGYTHIGIEEDADDTSEDVQEWNVGADFDIGAFGLGAAYKELDGSAEGEGDEVNTLVFGADYTTGPFQFGGSFLNEDRADTAADTNRYTGGVIYTVTQGLTLRGSVSYVDHERKGIGGEDIDATSVLGGVQFNF